MREEHDLSIITGLEGYRKDCAPKFTDYSKADLSSVGCAHGLVFWRAERDIEQSEYEISLYHDCNSTSDETEIKEKVKSALVAIASKHLRNLSLIQFWAAKVDDGGHHYLTTSDQPFSFSYYLCKGLCSFREVCMDHTYVVEEEGVKEEQLGAVGRVYRKKHPESTPDLRLYSIKEFPLRDHAARCGIRSYLALPVFDSLKNECYGVLEVLSIDTAEMSNQFLVLNQGLQEANLRSTHIHFLPISRYMESMPSKYTQQPESEIRKMLELAIKVVPQLLLAQVWVPCKQCAEMSSNLSCMERLTFINFKGEIVNSCWNIESDMFNYLQACEFQNLQIGKWIAKAVISSNKKSCFSRNLCDFSISENPLAHYAQKARLSLYFAYCLESVHTSNDMYVIEFFLQSACREDACDYLSLELLLRIMETELNNFALGGQLRQELLVELSNPNAIQHESTEYAQEMEGYRKSYSKLDFQKYLQTTDLCCHLPSKKRQCEWVFCSPIREELSENDFNINSPLVNNSIEGKIEMLMKKIASNMDRPSSYGLVQFWAPKMEEDRCYLATSDQPYALGCQGLAFIREQCVKHQYFVDERASEEELGPPGRVFRNGHLEITPDLRLYSTREFSLRNYAAHYCLRKYNALPVFDSHEHKCVGVLEFVGVSDSSLKVIGKALTEANLSSTHTNMETTFLASHLPANITKCRELALAEVKEAFELVFKIPQVYDAEVWVPYRGCACINSNLSCMELALFKRRRWESDLEICQDHVPKGIAGMVLASENKSCLFRSSYDFSIIEQPLAHYQKQERLDVCFAIGLQSSHTGNLPYVLQFFLHRGPAKYEHLWLFLKFLLPIMKQELKSFKVASGKQLEEELVVEAIGFSEADKLSLSELDQQDAFRVKFQYSQKEHQHANHRQMQYVCDGMDSVSSGSQAQECSIAAANSKVQSTAAKKTKRGKRKTGLHLTLKDLEQHYGRRLADVAEELGVGRSTIKRVLRENKITRWPNSKKYKKNPSLFMKEISASEIARDSQENMRPSSSGNLPQLDVPLYKNMPQTNAENVQNLTVQSAAEEVIIKVKYEDDIVRLDLCFSCGMDKLLEEVGRKLKLEKGSFKLKYVDEDNDEILLACDADLQHCPRSLTAVGKTSIHLFVKLIPN